MVTSGDIWLWNYGLFKNKFESGSHETLKRNQVNKHRYIKYVMINILKNKRACTNKKSRSNERMRNYGWWLSTFIRVELAWDKKITNAEVGIKQRHNNYRKISVKGQFSSIFHSVHSMDIQCCFCFSWNRCK